MRFILLLLMAMVSSGAAADMWECAEPGGGKRFTIIKADAEGCKQLNITLLLPIQTRSV
jgi:predicted small integral membrane protein